MGFNQNQDTLKTMRLVIFLIILEVLFIFSSVIMTYAQTGKDTLVLSDVPQLKVSDFVWNEHAKGGGYFSSGGGYEAKINGKTYTIYVKEGDISSLTRIINDQNSAELKGSFDYLKFLATVITFGAIPYPYNTIPLLITSLVGFILLYLAYGEVKTWIDSLIP
jgi:hypothetical protein